MSRNSKKNRDRRKAKRQLAAKARAHCQTADPFNSPLVTVERIHGIEQLETLLARMDTGTDAPWTVRVIASASGRHYKDGESIPLFDQHIIEAHPVDTLDKAQEQGEQLEIAIRESGDYPDEARTSIVSAPESGFDS